MLFADGFESRTGDPWSAWATDGGGLRIEFAAALDGYLGLSANLTAGQSIYAIDTAPADVATYHARFRFDPNGVQMADSQPHTLFSAISPSATTTIDVQLRRSSGGYDIKVGTRLDDGTRVTSTWQPLSDAPHSIEVGWASSTSNSSPNGVQELWVDGVPRASLSGLSNAAQRVTEARLGPQGVPSGVHGVEYFDDFVSTLTSYIGS